MNIIVTLIIGGIAGWLAGIIRRGSGFGWITNIVLGIVGSFVGSFNLGLLGLNSSGILGNIIVSTIGAVIVLFILNLFSREK